MLLQLQFLRFSSVEAKVIGHQMDLWTFRPLPGRFAPGHFGPGRFALWTIRCIHVTFRLRTFCPIHVDILPRGVSPPKVSVLGFDGNMCKCGKMSICLGCMSTSRERNAQDRKFKGWNAGLPVVLKFQNCPEIVLKSVIVLKFNHLVRMSWYWPLLCCCYGI